MQSDNCRESDKFAKKGIARRVVLTVEVVKGCEKLGGFAAIVSSTLPTSVYRRVEIEIVPPIFFQRGKVFVARFHDGIGLPEFKIGFFMVNHRFWNT